MKIAIIGTGRVGGMFIQHLIANPNISELLLINRTVEKSEGVLLDTASAFPQHADKMRISEYKDTDKADIIVICAGGTLGAKDGVDDTLGLNKKITKEILSKCSLKKESIIVTLTFQIDIIAQYIQELTGHAKSRVIGFGGSLDVNRLRYLLSEETGKNVADIKASFIGEHGFRGISIFSEKVDDYDEINEETKTIAREIASRLEHSTEYGPAKALSDFVETIVNDSREVLCASTYHPKYKMYLTWPCVIGKSGVVEIVNLELNKKDQDALETLVEIKRKESS